MKRPLVAIVLATYEPDLGFFQKQIESLERQTHSRWICLLSDDASDRKRAKGFHRFARELVERDSRFRFLEHEGRVGVYHNFERGLAAVPEAASFVCFSDQDDIWVPHKLETLVRAFDERDVWLAHSDLSIIDDQDRLVHPSCWEWEGRNVTRFEPEWLLLKNTITGCATMFRRELLPVLLPFPCQGIRPGHSHFLWHHDLWTALIASGLGDIRAIPEPLLLYRRHEANVLGPVADRGVGTRWRQLARELSPQSLRRYAGWSLAEWNLRHRLAVAYEERLSEAAERGFTVRHPRLKGFGSRPDFGMGTLSLSARALYRGYGTQGASVRTTLGKLGHDLKQLQRIAEGGLRVNRRLMRSARENLETYLFKAELFERPWKASDFVDLRSQRSLPITVKPSAPAFNLLLPNVRREHIFGGIATALKLGIELTHAGAQVRFLATDTELSPAIRDEFAEYLRQQGLDGPVHLFDASEKTAETLPLGKDDFFVATAWWTAWLAHKALQEHAFRETRFVYLIQDYEPCFSPWSQDFALARGSYGLNSIAIYNTGFLKRFFDEQRLTRKPHWVIRPEVDLSRFFPALEEDAKQEKIRLLIYGRPGVARNLFSTVIASLDEWIRKHDFRPATLEIVSAGERHPAVECAGGIRITSVGKVDGSLYPSFLRGFDIGLSLMLSPHPSYPPLEMAASGVVTVTNRYEGKDLETLSNNFVSCDPTPPSVVEALDRALIRVPRRKERKAASRLRFDDAQPLSEVAAEVARLLTRPLPAPGRKRRPAR